MRWKLIVAIHDFLVYAHGVVIVKRRVPCQHFEDKNTESPPVYILVVALGLDNFRCQVLRRATQCVSLVLDDFSEAEICDFDVTFSIDE